MVKTYIVSVEVDCAYYNDRQDDFYHVVEYFSFPIYSDLTGIELENYAQSQAERRIGENESLLSVGLFEHLGNEQGD